MRSPRSRPGFVNVVVEGDIIPPTVLSTNQTINLLGTFPLRDVTYKDVIEHQPANIAYFDLLRTNHSLDRFRIRLLDESFINEIPIKSGADTRIVLNILEQPKKL